MITLFDDMIYTKIKIYVDDMIAKSPQEERHVTNLWKLFKRQKKYQLKLNMAISTFSTRSGKLLGFIVSERGIEVDLNKIEAFRSCHPHAYNKK